MFKNWFLVKALAALILIGLLVAGGWAIYRIGWSQGYVAAGGGDGATVPDPYGFGHPGRRFGFMPFPRGFTPFLFGAGLFFRAGLFLLLLVLIGRFLFFRPWRFAGGPQSAHWHRHWRRPRGPIPPWYWGCEKPSEGKAEKAEPDAETGDAETEFFKHS